MSVIVPSRMQRSENTIKIPTTMLQLISLSNFLFQMLLIFQSTILFQIFYQGVSQILQPMPFPPGMLPMPPANAPGQMTMPGPIQMPGPIPMPGAMPMPLQVPGQKLPIVVMPYYSKAKKYPRRHKKRRRAQKFYYKSSSSSESDSSDTESSDSSSELGRSGKHDGRRRQVLTPVVSYVTKDGYVVYQKKIKKEKARDWLTLDKGKSAELSNRDRDELDMREMKRSRKKRRHR